MSQPSARIGSSVETNPLPLDEAADQNAIERAQRWQLPSIHDAPRTERFAVELNERSVGKLARRLGFSRLSEQPCIRNLHRYRARAQHVADDLIEAGVPVGDN